MVVGKLSVKRKLLIVLAVGALVAVLTWGWVAYHQLRPSVATLQADTSLSANALFAAFSSDELAAGHHFMDKILEVQGIVQAVDTSSGQVALLLQTSGNGNINCLLRDKPDGNQSEFLNRQITIKGKCAGYLVDVSLVDCIIQ
ncbi:OB-fold protein [Flavihumibacter petaseus]|uniref:tRNA_anti-like n=1 Tax=Flavihumibacter petaseus NBRC 106054 TaxID=1220578 RepID=A0A0E9N289_9BACT|nr:hypothetical protein [Flavihumibacter petaseus]GAO43898.1 hypothetical protein FPE01S_02_10040 [Flavihumibacter petaseus NBRC 106054]